MPPGGGDHPGHRGRRWRGGGPKGAREKRNVTALERGRPAAGLLFLWAFCIKGVPPSQTRGQMPREGHCVKIVSKQEYSRRVEKASPPSPVGKDCLLAFLFGGPSAPWDRRCAAFTRAWGWSFPRPGPGVFHQPDLPLRPADRPGPLRPDGRTPRAGHPGAHHGVANSMVSPALGSSPRALSPAWGAKLFSIAGPVLVFGVSASGAVRAGPVWPVPSHRGASDEAPWKKDLEGSACPPPSSPTGRWEERGGGGAPWAGTSTRPFRTPLCRRRAGRKAEAQLQKEAVAQALSSGGPAGGGRLHPGGDLLNQCISSTFGLLDFRIPFLGQYGACSTGGPDAAGGVHPGGERRRPAGRWPSPAPTSARQSASSACLWNTRRPAGPTAQWTATAAGLRPGGLGRAGGDTPGPGRDHSRPGSEGCSQHGGGHGPRGGGEHLPVPGGHRHPPSGLRRHLRGDLGGGGLRAAVPVFGGQWHRPASGPPGLRPAALRPGAPGCPRGGPQAAGARPRCFAATCCAAWSGESCGASCSAPRGR